jgi:hypothetical protein
LRMQRGVEEALSSSQTLVLTRATQRNIPENIILHSHCHENVKSYRVYTVSVTISLSPAKYIDTFVKKYVYCILIHCHKYIHVSILGYIQKWNNSAHHINNSYSNAYLKLRLHSRIPEKHKLSLIMKMTSCCNFFISKITH